jgi:hypothetical protein
MTIVHKVDEFFLNLFPKAKLSGNDIGVLKEELANYYSYGPYKPTVSIDGDIAKIEIDTSTIIKQDADYRKAVSLCEKGKYAEAKKILARLISENPTNSEYYRIYGQILSDEGNQDEAINYLIDALRWDSKNAFALLMMGNIFAKFKKDIETARRYYNQVLVVNPIDNIALNNIGANLLQLGNVQDGVDFLEKAYAVNPNYPNTTYGLTMAYDLLGFPLMAFEFATHTIKISTSQPQMQKMAASSASQLAEKYLKERNGFTTFEEYRAYLEGKVGKEIRVEQDSSLPTAAKIEFAENYDRDYHLIKYKPNYKAVEHLMMHELVHLKFATEARTEHKNMLFISGRDRKVEFIRDSEKEIKKLERDGISDSSISSFINALYDGINRQIYNAPIDLFIEDYLYEVYKEIRPQQFLSLMQLVNEGQAAITNKQAEKYTPRIVYSASKILNIVSAIQLKDLYGVDIVKQFNPLPHEMKEAQRMWEEFSEYRKDRKPGEEYEIVQHWGEDLKLEKYFELVDEEDFRNRPKTVEDVLQSVEEDPFGTEVDKNFKSRQTKKFLEAQAGIGLNHAVLWFMVDALQYFKGMNGEKIKKIAFEIAMIGTQGINPAPGHKYHVPSIPGKEFSGYHLLAYYFVSWKLAIPEMVSQLNLPYEKEYEAAQSLKNNDD